MWLGASRKAERSVKGRELASPRSRRRGRRGKSNLDLDFDCDPGFLSVFSMTLSLGLPSAGDPHRLSSARSEVAQARGAACCCVRTFLASPEPPAKIPKIDGRANLFELFHLRITLLLYMRDSRQPVTRCFGFRRKERDAKLGSHIAAT
ncbi:unnamed protein product [Symbiodinium sp. KB8]|nr:unnamed protein product [Symbiodinium sp. KB8]